MSVSRVGWPHGSGDSTQEAPSPWRTRRARILAGMCEVATGRGESAWMLLWRQEASPEACVTRIGSYRSVRSPGLFARARTLSCDGTWPRVMGHIRRERRVTAPDASRQPHMLAHRWSGIFLDRYHPEKTQSNPHISPGKPGVFVKNPVRMHARAGKGSPHLTPSWMTYCDKCTQSQHAHAQSHFRRSTGC